jgi:hypothetical protein
MRAVIALGGYTVQRNCLAPRSDRSNFGKGKQQIAAKDVFPCPQ